MRRTVAPGGRPLSAAPSLLRNTAGRNNLSIITPPPLYSAAGRSRNAAPTAARRAVGFFSRPHRKRIRADGGCVFCGGFFPLGSGRNVLGEGNRRKAKPCLPSFALQNSHSLSSAVFRVFVFQKHFRRFPNAFSRFKRTFAVCPARFRASKAFSRLPRRGFRLQKNFRGFPNAFSRFKNTFVASPTRFHASKALLSLARRDFSVQKFFCCLLGAVLGFKTTFVTCPACFRASKALLRLSRRNFGLQKYFRSCLCVFSPLKSAPEASPGAFSAFKSTLSQGVALLTEFLLARTARIFAALRQKTQKLVVFIQVEQKSS